MSTFKGCLIDLENVLVDYFFINNSYTCFFLSHCHTDHMHGIKELLCEITQTDNKYLYCSPLSKLILLNKFKGCDRVIKELTNSTVINVPESNVSPSYQITVTPIPAGHCPGSIMFLFETVNKTILYTGDFRISKGDIKKFKALHNNNVVKIIDKLYFDATFLSETYWNFPTRSEVVEELIIIIKNWMAKHPDNNIILETSASFGYEYIFVELASKFKCKIHVKDCIYELFWNVPQIGTILTKNCKETKIHCNRKGDEFCSGCQNDETVLKIKLSAQWYKCDAKNTNKPIWMETSKNKFIICYSTHCSCSELIDFLTYLHPVELEACTSTVCCSEEKKKMYIQKLHHSWSTTNKNDSSQLRRKNIFPENIEKIIIKFPNLKKKCYEDFTENFESSKKIKND